LTTAELYEVLSKRVEQRENGDVLVTGIPMIDQGRKGYCVPSTWARYLKYMGIPADEYALANAGGTAKGGGTSTAAMASAAQSLVRKHRRDIDKIRGRASVNFVKKYVDKGLPLMWTMYSVGPFKGTGGKSTRMGKLSPQEWDKKLGSKRDSAERIEVDRNQGHVCMIIGYNETTGEIATSDSWGPSHAEKWYTEEEVDAVSRGEFYLIK